MYTQTFLVRINRSYSLAPIDYPNTCSFRLATLQKSSRAIGALTVGKIS